MKRRRAHGWRTFATNPPALWRFTTAFIVTGTVPFQKKLGAPSELLA